MLSIKTAKSFLRDDFSRYFGVNKTLKNFDERVWSEGGEWPIFDEIKYCKPTNARPFAWPENVTQLRDVQQATRHVDVAFANVNVAAISLPCGVGKSTHLMTNIARTSAYTTIICVQPSALSAQQLCEYVHTNNSDLMVSRHLDKSTKSLVYVSAGEFLKILYDSFDLGNCLIVIDEYHSINPVYKALEKVLALSISNILCLTASATSNLRARNGVNVIPTSHFDTKLTEAIMSSFKTPDTNLLVVGCSSGLSVHEPANLYVGLTLDTTCVVDFATRLDPTYDENGLLLTYRKASVTETTQMLGRLARIKGTSGTFHYITNPGQFMYQGRPKLFSRVYDALISAFGMGIESNSKSIYNTLACISSPVGNSIRSVASSIAPKHSVASSRKSAHSSSSNATSSYSSVRSPMAHETQRVRKTSSGYLVDYIPNDPVKRFFSTRASTWTAHPPSCQVTSYDRQNNMLNCMNDEVHADIRDELQPPLVLPTDQRMHTEELAHVNDIISGKVMPTYQPEEMHMVQRAWHTFLAANPQRFNRVVNSLEFNVRTYFAAYKRIRDMYRSI